MADRRAQVMAAAIDLLGDGGAKALTHRGVDQAAGVPQGTTANHFRTADALVAAVAIELERLDAEQWHQGASPSWTGITEAGRDIAKFAGALTRPPLRNRTRARIVLSVTHPEIIGAGHHRLRQYFRAAISEELGIDLGPATVATLAGLVDGLVLHHVTVNPEPLDEAALASAIARLFP